MDKIKLIQELIEQANKLKFNDDIELDLIKRRADVYICNIFGIGSKYRRDIEDIYFWPMVHPSPKEYEVEIWEEGKSKLLNIFTMMKEELIIFDEKFQRKPSADGNETKNITGNSKDKIFIVHGHDDAMKESVARVVERFGIEAIILHERTDKGRHIMEKLEGESKDVGFAIVLLSGDDICYSGFMPDKQRTRARQNVVFELGYFIGKLGKDRVLSLYTQDKNFEMPSDYSGVLYTEYDATGMWKYKLGKELKSSGYDIDLNEL
ncbi:TIR domain-containing protein [Tissierella praeacuta]|uniref:TIR domain-containing protein n=1 Tax=Tissierella praeacuta TaxID=43131 RepID=UPI003DA56850